MVNTRIRSADQGNPVQERNRPPSNLDKAREGDPVELPHSGWGRGAGGPRRPFVPLLLYAWPGFSGFESWVKTSNGKLCQKKSPFEKNQQLNSFPVKKQQQFETPLFLNTNQPCQWHHRVLLTYARRLRGWEI